MSRSYWIAGIALGLALNFQASAQEATDLTLEDQPVTEERQAERAAASESEAQGHQAAASENLLFVQGIESSIREPVAEQYQSESNTQNEREQRD